MREYCLAQLSRALEENGRVCGGLPATRDPETAAVGLEYGVFLRVKSAQMYKLTVHKKVVATGS